MEPNYFNMRRHKTIIYKKWIKRLLKQYNINKNCYVLLKPVRPKDWPTVNWLFRTQMPKGFTDCRQAVNEMTKFQKHKLRYEDCACSVPKLCLFYKVDVHTLIKNCEEKNRDCRNEQTKDLCQASVPSLTGCTEDLCEDDEIQDFSQTGSSQNMAKRDCIMTLRPHNIALQADTDGMEQTACTKDRCEDVGTTVSLLTEDGRMTVSSRRGSLQELAKIKDCIVILQPYDIVYQADTRRKNGFMGQTAETKDQCEDVEMTISSPTGSKVDFCENGEMIESSITGFTEDPFKNDEMQKSSLTGSKSRVCSVPFRPYTVSQIVIDDRNECTKQTAQAENLCKDCEMTITSTGSFTDLCEDGEMQDSSLTESPGDKIRDCLPFLSKDIIPQTDTDYKIECIKHTAQSKDLCEDRKMTILSSVGSTVYLCKNGEMPLSSPTEFPEAKIRNFSVPLQPYIVPQIDTDRRYECIEQITQKNDLCKGSEMTKSSLTASLKDLSKDGEMPVPTGSPADKIRNCIVSQTDTESRNTCVVQTAQTNNLCRDVEMTISSLPEFPADLCGGDDRMQNPSLTGALEDKIRDCIVPLRSNSIVPESDSDNRNKYVESNHLRESGKMTIPPSIGSIEDLCEESEMQVSLLTGSPEDKIGNCSIPSWPFSVPQIDADGRNRCIKQIAQTKDQCKVAEITTSSLTGSQQQADRNFVDEMSTPSVSLAKNNNASSSSKNEYIDGIPVESETDALKRSNPYNRDSKMEEEDILCEGSVSDLTMKCVLCNGT